MGPRVPLKAFNKVYSLFFSKKTFLCPKARKRKSKNVISDVKGKENTASISCN